MASGFRPPAAGDETLLPKADSREPTAKLGNLTNGEIMNEHIQLDKSSQPAAGDERLQQKLESLESGLKELADAFRKFSEGFAKSLSPADKRVARTSVTVSKQEDSARHSDRGDRIQREGAQGDADAGFLEAMKSAHANPAIGA